MVGAHGRAPLRALALPTAEQRDALESTLHLAADFAFYRCAFDDATLAVADVRADPVAALARLPIFDTERFDALAVEALARRAHDLGGVELTSGTSGGRPKRRVFSEEDVTLDAALVTRLLHLAGVRASDRAVAAELTVTPLAAAFLEGCERLGVRHSVALALTPGSDLAPLLRLDPTVLIAPPSLLRLVTPALAQADALPSLRITIYNGDRLDAATAAAFHAHGVGVRSLYGLTETSALGVSCPREDGVHLATDHALAELRPVDGGDELIITTLGYSMPLLRYPTGDRVRALAGACACGSPWPRVEILGRLDGRFAMFEVKFTVEEFAPLLGVPEAAIQVELSDGPDHHEVISFCLPLAERPHRRRIMKRLRDHPLLSYLLKAGLVRAHLRFRDAPPERKLVPLRDRRLHPEDSDA